MEAKLKSTAQVVKKGDHLNLWLEAQGFDMSDLDEKPITCSKEVEIEGEYVTEWLIYRQ